MFTTPGLTSIPALAEIKCIDSFSIHGTPCNKNMLIINWINRNSKIGSSHTTTSKPAVISNTVVCCYLVICYYLASYPQSTELFCFESKGIISDNNNSACVGGYGWPGNSRYG